MMRKYSKIDLLQFAKFANENEGLKPLEQLKAYDAAFPELSEKQKMINIAKRLRIDYLYERLTGEELPPEEGFEGNENIPFVSGACKGEVCSMCGNPATNKLGEEILFDDPNKNRHNLTTYVCRDHFNLIMRHY